MRKNRTIIRLVDQPTLQSQEELAPMLEELVHIMADHAFAAFIGRKAANAAHFDVEELST